jgi:hypothetical protein
MVQPRKKQSTNLMATKVCFLMGATCGIGSEIAKSALVDGNQAVATDRKPEPAAKALSTPDNLLPVPLDLTSEEPARGWLLDLFTPVLVESRCLPSVAFTPSGPLVYEWETYRY